jgi:hypothetical protein
MGASIKFTVGGREVPLSQFGNELRKGVETLAKTEIGKRIEAAECPVHHRRATNVRSYMAGGKMQWTFDACCDELKKAVAATLSQGA